MVAPTHQRRRNNGRTTRMPHACWERLVDVGTDFSSVVSHSMQLRVAAHFILKIHKDFERARGVENELQK
jgi:hypothetical protein